MDLLKGLNKEQKEAVVHNEGPLLILAGAGSGKTRVLTHRIAYLIKEYNVLPSSILAITFTNKAAGEMKGRVEKLVGNQSENIWVSTFHSTCVRILRREIDRIGFDKSFIIFDYGDQQTVIKECIKQLNINDKLFPPKSLLETIGRAKDELLTPEAFSKLYANDFRLGKVASVYELYQKKLRQNNALDFDDIIMYCVKLFMDNPDVLEYYQKKFKYVLVDEYQDTNTSQYSLISLLAKASKNLCVVGDDDQSIYGWRGANIKNILDFEKEFKGCKVIKLEQNYRSTQVILDAANNVIKNNSGRKNKKLWTENSGGEKINRHELSTEHEEAMFVASEIKRISKENNKSFKDFAVLYRINAQSRVIEEMLIKEEIPYKIVGGLKFYDRKEIKDLIAYLRVIQNPSDNVALKRIINVPKRGIGGTTVEGAEDIARARGCSLFSIVSSASDIIDLKRAAPKLDGFVSLINGFRVFKDGNKISELIEEILDKSGIIKELESENTVEAQSRIENIKEFISVAIEFETKSEDQSLEEFLATISLISDIDNIDENKESVILMTFHSAKGLEFPVVFMVGVEEGVFPGYKSMNSESELEEERRLCYVGITRAKESVYITNAFCRTLFGNTTYNYPSRFIKEIPRKLINDLNSSNTSSNTIGSKSTSNMKNNSIIGNKIENWSNTVALRKQDVSQLNFSVGDNVEHKKFGVGVITSIEKENDDYKLEIAFNNVGTKRLMAGYANLEKLA